ncbi:MAG: serine/threonine protein kinase, partial [Polyangiaceae bacterium]|nr:serine/threonine protein kinase [Polyangiaceae bacterium]
MHRAPVETEKTRSRASDGVTEDWSAVDDWHAVARSKVGQTLGGYELCELLGVGGMGAVFRARQRGQPAVALKLLRPDLAMTARGRSRFRREASAANRVGHPGAVRVLDDGEHEQAVYLVLELLEGKTVARLARERGGTLPADQVRRIAVDVLDVLAAAHDRGVVHRDIKPDNIFTTNAGRVKVLDFGLSIQSDLAHDSRVTASGATLGTPGYMAPEQAAGHRARVGPRSDLWALGATLFRLLSGRRVHLAGNAAEALIAAATRVAPRIASVVPDVPADLAHAIDRALAFELGARWQDARSMQRALESREARPEDVEPLETTLGDSRPRASGLPQVPHVETAVARVGPRRSDRRIADARAPAARGSWLLAGIGLSLLVVLVLVAGGIAWR